MKKHALHFASWNMVIAFIISWGIWIILDKTAFEYGWLTTNDGFLITCIFTVSSFIRVYFTNLFQLYYIHYPDGKVRQFIEYVRYRIWLIGFTIWAMFP